MTTEKLRTEEISYGADWVRIETIRLKPLPLPFEIPAEEKAKIKCSIRHMDYEYIPEVYMDIEANDGSYWVITGQTHVEIYKELGFEFIKCRPIPDKLDYKGKINYDALKFRSLVDLRSQIQLPTWARVLIARELKPLFQQYTRTKQLSKLKNSQVIVETPDEIKEMIIDGKTADAMACEFGNCDKETFRRGEKLIDMYPERWDSIVKGESTINKEYNEVTRKNAAQPEGVVDLAVIKETEELLSKLDKKLDKVLASDIVNYDNVEQYKMKCLKVSKKLGTKVADVIRKQQGEYDNAA